MAKEKITCECGFVFSAKPESSDRYVRCPECGIRIHLEQVKAAGEIFLSTGVFRKTGFTSSVEGSLVVTLDSISFIGPASEHPMSSKAWRYNLSGPPSVSEAVARKEMDDFVDFRKGKRTLYEQITDSPDIEKKIKQLARYRQKSVRIRRKAIHSLAYDGGSKLVVITEKNKYSFSIPKPQRAKLRNSLRQNRYI